MQGKCAVYIRKIRLLSEEKRLLYLKKQCSKVQVIVTFLSVLELIKMGHIHVVQEEIFDDIQINVVTEPETWKNLTEFAEEEG